MFKTTSINNNITAEYNGIILLVKDKDDLICKANIQLNNFTEYNDMLNSIISLYKNKNKTKFGRINLW